MRISLRLIILLIVGVTFVALLFAYSEVKAEQRALRSDLQNRAQLLADSLAQSVELLLYYEGRIVRLETCRDERAARTKAHEWLLIIPNFSLQ